MRCTQGLCYTENKGGREQKVPEGLAGKDEAQNCFGLARANRFDGEILTWPALVPHEEVFAGSRARICAKQPAIDKELAAPSVLALVQHLLQQGMHTDAHKRQKNESTSVSPKRIVKCRQAGEGHGNPCLLNWLQQ